MKRPLAFRHLKRSLALAQEQRDNLNVDHPCNEGTAWVEFERLVMLATVNQLRRAEGKKPVSYDALLGKESLASGHSDYTTKFALGCAELLED